MNKEKYKAKFADKLMKERVMIPQVFTAGYDMIDEICSDYESRTCENCKYYTKTSEQFGYCVKLPVQFMLLVDFGCNRFERITNGL